MTREIPRVVRFDRRPHLDKLIRELTESFATRYEEPPTARDLQALEDALEAHVPESVIFGVNNVLAYAARCYVIWN